MNLSATDCVSALTIYLATLGVIIYLRLLDLYIYYISYLIVTNSVHSRSTKAVSVSNDLLISEPAAG